MSRAPGKKRGSHAVLMQFVEYSQHGFTKCQDCGHQFHQHRKQMHGSGWGCWAPGDKLHTKRCKCTYILDAEDLALRTQELQRIMAHELGNRLEDIGDRANM